MEAVRGTGEPILVTKREEPLAESGPRFTARRQSQRPAR
jgi:hypothetical protein